MGFAIKSLKLTPGYGLYIANSEGANDYLLANESTIRIAALSEEFKLSPITHLRVVEWKNLTKKGYMWSDLGDGTSWRYNWSAKSKGDTKSHFVPMAFGYPMGLDPVLKASVRDHYNHLLSFNESDICGKQGAGWSTPCQDNGNWTEVPPQVEKHALLHQSGLRIGSPAPHENGLQKWLIPFMAEAKQQNARVDFIALHWYDWGGLKKEEKMQCH